MAVNMTKNDPLEAPWNQILRHVSTMRVMHELAKFEKYVGIPVVLNSIVSYDSVLGDNLSPTHNETFLSYKNFIVEDNPKYPHRHEIMRITFHIDTTAIDYKRVAFSLVDLTSQLGGFLVPLRLAFSMLVDGYSELAYKLSMISMMFSTSKNGQKCKIHYTERQVFMHFFKLTSLVKCFTACFVAIICCVSGPEPSTA